MALTRKFATSIARQNLLGEIIRDMLTASKLFTDVATGRAAVANGDYFGVPNIVSGNVDIYQRVNSTTSPLIMSISGQLGIDAITATVNDIANRVVITPGASKWAYKFKSRSGKIYAGFDITRGWVFGAMTMKAVNAQGITATSLTAPAGTIDLVTANKLVIPTGFLQGGRTGKALSLKSFSGKVIFDILASGLARFSSIQVKTVAANSATISSLTSSSLVIGSATISSLTLSGPLVLPANNRVESKTTTHMFRGKTASGKVIFNFEPDGTLVIPKLRVKSTISAGGTITGAASTAAYIRVRDSAIGNRNANLPSHPTGTENPGIISNNLDLYGLVYTSQAASCALIERDDGTVRVFVCYYGQNREPDSGAVTGTSQSFTTIAYCDNIFDASPTWHKILFIVPVPVNGDESCVDPQLFALPDGRLQISYATQNHTGRVRVGYAMLITNPGTTVGTFNVGRQYFLDYGVPSAPFMFNADVNYLSDNWGVNQYVCKLSYPADDQIVSTRISTIPRPTPLSIEIFYESSGVQVSGGEMRVYFRTTEGYHTRLSSGGRTSWGANERVTDYPTPNSRACFKRVPSLGWVVGAVDVDAANHRSNLNLILSQAEGAVGTFTTAFSIEPDPSGTFRVSAQYPTVQIDRSGNVFTAYRYADSTSGSPLPEAIVITRLNVDKLASGTATSADVTRVVVSLMNVI